MHFVYRSLTLGSVALCAATVGCRRAAAPVAETTREAPAVMATPKASDKNKVNVRLVPLHRDKTPGWDVVAVEFRIAPHWHIYWIYPGDSGLATKIKLPDHPNPTDIAVDFPAPEHFVSQGGIVGYGYEDQTALFIAMGQNAVPGEQLRVKVSWLVCREACEPGKATLTLSKTAQGMAWTPALHEAYARIPKPWPNDAALPTWSESTPGHARLRFGAQLGQPKQMFPYKLHPVAMQDQSPSRDANALRVNFTGPTTTPWPGAAKGVLQTQTPQGANFFEFALPWPAPAAPSGVDSTP